MEYGEPDEEKVDEVVRDPPAAQLGRTLAVLEALAGQLYLVTVLALLVSRLRGGDRKGT